ARVVGDPHGAALVTRLPMSAEYGGAAGLNRAQGPELDRREAVRLTIGVAVRADDVRKLHPRRDDRGRRAPRHGTHEISSAAAG
ncbi:MAG TPA: hypothetical protein VIK60_13600, partial [Vicinamibacterales bacterium]